MRPIGLMPNGSRLTMPSTQKVRGLQIQRTNDARWHFDDHDPPVEHDGFWPTNGEFYAAWPWDEVIKPEIDLAVAMGANTVKFCCAVHGIYIGLYDSATHEARLRQFLDYTASLRVRAYMCVYFLGSEGAPNPMNTPDVAAELVKAVGIIGEYPHVIGVDCANESGWYEFVAWCRPRFKAVAPRLPITISVIVSGPTHWLDYPPSLAPYVDFYDFHPYYLSGGVPIADHLAEFRASEFHKPWIIGEIGHTAEFYDAIAAFVAAPDCFGSVAYSTFDCTLTYGFADPDGTIIAADRLAAFQTWPAWPPQTPTV